MIAFGLVSIFLFLLIISLVSAVFLRASCAGYNKFFARRHPNVEESLPDTSEFFDEANRPEVEPESSDNPYASTSAVSSKPMQEEQRPFPGGVIEPSFGSAYVTCVLSGVLNMLASFMISQVAPEPAIASALNAIVGCLILVVVLMMRYDMKAGQAFGVFFIAFAIGLFLAVVVGGVAYVAGISFR